MPNHDIYPYPFKPSLLANRNVDSARAESQKLGRWVFIPKDGIDHTQLHGTFRITVEPNAFVFTDSDKGIIKFQFFPDNNGDLIVKGGIYNPKKGNETIFALLDILKYISRSCNRNITYRTHRINRTQQLAELLLSNGFTQNGEEFEILIQPVEQSKYAYPEVDEEVVRLRLHE